MHDVIMICTRRTDVHTLHDKRERLGVGAETVVRSTRVHVLIVQCDVTELQRAVGVQHGTTNDRIVGQWSPAGAEQLAELTTCCRKCH